MRISSSSKNYARRTAGFTSQDSELVSYREVSLVAEKEMRFKAYILLFLLIFVILWLIFNAFRIQIIQGQNNLKLATSTSRSENILRAPRGLIFDAKGNQLVSNEASFNVYTLPAEIPAKKVDETLNSLAQVLTVDSQELKNKFNKSAYTAKGDVVGERVTLVYNLDYEKYLASYNQIQQLPGMYVSIDTKRIYNSTASTSQLLGYLGDVTAKDVETAKLDPKAQIGKEGLERTYDNYLRGEDGIEVTQNSNNSELDKSWIPKSYQSGANLKLNVDLDWQNNLNNYVKKYSDSQQALGGAAVIMEIDTGKVKALVSYPSYDANVFAQGISYKDYQALTASDQDPLLNRSIAMSIPTGSVYKAFVASALLEENVITKNTVYASGCYKLPGDYQICEADKKNYGRLTMTQAIARSSNPYFCQAIVDMAKKKGSDDAAIRKLDEYLAAYSFGKLTGIDLAGELPGKLPTPELKQKIQGEPWYLADLCNTVIGQGLVEATPIQIVTAAAAILNNGKVYQPQLVDQIEFADQSIKKIEPVIVATENVKPEYYAQIREGMKQAVEYGSATGLKGVPGNPIAKTGSADATYTTKNGKLIRGAHSWALGGFDYQGKKYAFVVSLQFGGRGYKSVPIAADFLKCLYNNFSNCK